jgi:Spy/CpxP family protein refolding chaperone
VGFATLYAQDQSASTPASPSASTGAEKQHGWGRHHRFAHFLKQLNLTDAQKQQMKQYFSDNKQTLVALQQKRDARIRAPITRLSLYPAAGFVMARLKSRYLPPLQGGPHT